MRWFKCLLFENLSDPKVSGMFERPFVPVGMIICREQINL